ncbi:putative protein S-acyltransferase 7 [Nymphaea thermarum]|nr:putative protein S-acyltransferase 7 [Nymphaea thermarum]
MGNPTHVLVSLIAVTGSDPGIVPRNEEAPLEEDVSRSKRISVNGIQVKRKYCRICKLFRPPRSCHCAICDNCVERFDHHCIWIGQCIGQHNYRFYVIFISITFIFYAYIFSFSWWAIKRKMSESGVGVFDVMGHAPEIMVLTLFSFIAIWFLGGLTSFHIYLISINQTSYENFRGRYVGTTNPYHNGVLNNIKEILFSKLPFRKANFRAEVQPGWFPADSSPEKMPENGFSGEKGGGFDEVGKQQMKSDDAWQMRTPSDAGSSSEHFEDVDLDFKP